MHFSAPPCTYLPANDLKYSVYWEGILLSLSRFCPLIMPAGRPKTAPPPGELYSFAHLFYWEFRRLIEGSHRFRMDEQRFAKLRSEAEKKPVVLDVDQIASINRGIE